MQIKTQNKKPSSIKYLPEMKRNFDIINVSKEVNNNFS